VTEPHLLVDVRDGIAVLTMKRPDKRNALSPEVLVRLARARRQVRDDAAVRVAVLAGTGDKACCAGADLRRLIRLMTRQRGPEDQWDEALLSDKAAFADRARAGTADTT
jgi:enoyl-CoA hydratase